MNWNDVTLQLCKPLDSKHVKPAPQGKYGDYIEGWHAIDEANRIFGFNGWSYRVDVLTKTYSEFKNEKHFIGYMAMVTVDVAGVTRQDVGHGQGVSKSEGDAHEGATKEAVTDALKRALRTFGNPFGLALYDKTKANVVDADAVSRDCAVLENCTDITELSTRYADIYRRWHNAPPAEIVATKNTMKAKLAEDKDEAA